MGDSNRRQIDYGYTYQRGFFRGKTVREMLLMSYVVEDCGCWRWTRGFGPGGYGHFGFTVDGVHMVEAPHRAFAEMLGGLDIHGGMVLHSCDNRWCVNPNHLRVGTCQDNHDDMGERNRRALGSSRPSSKLSAREVLEIREKAAQVSQATIAAEYGVCQMTVSRIVRRVKWAHV